MRMSGSGVLVLRLVVDLNEAHRKMRTVSTRQVAWEVIYEVESAGEYSNLLLPRILRSHDFEARDRGFITELVYGTLRMRGLCDSAISKHSDRALDSIDLKVLVALRLGAYQLLQMEVSPHAAVSETVDLAKTVAGKSSSGFVNAILRRITEDLDYEPKDIESAYSHPTWIVNAFRDVLKSEDLLKAQLRANNVPATPTLIPWPGRCEPDELFEAGASKIEGSLRAFKFDGNPGDIPAIRDRRAGVQDLGSQILTEIFFRTGAAGMRWLDLCAGPGGKAAYLDSLVSDGEFIANEVAPERTNLVRQVVTRGKVTSFDGRTIHEHLEGFDRILIDAPCTGLGALRRRPEVRWRRKASDLRELIQLQSELLGSAAKALRVGGIIGYATCSPHLAETKMQVRNFLNLNENFERVSVGEMGDSDGDLQLWTFRDGTDCMYLALLRKIGL